MNKTVINVWCSLVNLLFLFSYSIDTILTIRTSRTVYLERNDDIFLMSLGKKSRANFSLYGAHRDIIIFGRTVYGRNNEENINHLSKQNLCHSYY